MLCDEGKRLSRFRHRSRCTSRAQS